MISFDERRGSAVTAVGTVRLAVFNRARRLPVTARWPILNFIERAV
jgi:hypothetical protein